MTKKLMDFKEPVFFVNPDAYLAVGLTGLLPDFHIVCMNHSPVVGALREKGVSVFCLEEFVEKERFKSSRHLLRHEKTLSFVREKASGKTANLLFFKLNFDLPALLEREDADFSYRVLNTSAKIARLLENKTRLTELLGSKYFPPQRVEKLGKIKYERLAREFGRKMMFQFGRGWAGNSSFVIDSAEEFDKLKKDIPYSQKKVKVAEFIEAPTLTVNACVTEDEVYVGCPFYQVTGVDYLTPFPAGSCGNSWRSVPEKTRGKVLEKGKEIGGVLLREGFRGFFGLDFLVDEEKVYLVEVNPRLTASATTYTKMELEEGKTPLLLAHLAQFVPGDVFSVSQLEIHEKPFSASKLSKRNLGKAPVVIKGEVPLGIYSFENNGLNFLRSGLTIGDLKSNDELLIISEGVGTEVNLGQEFVRVISKGQLVDENLQPNSEVKDLFETLEGRLKING